jgi:uncharacterized SAM-binding protein YcdF (DUF218 family)
MRNFLIILFAVLAILITVVSVYLTPDDLRQCPGVNQKSECQKADAIVAVSGGNTSVRAAEAIRLYKQGWADTLIFSGAAADTSGPSNAEVMRRQALEADVPASDIKVETLAQTTRQNAERTKALLVEVGGGGAKRVILVTSPYHQRRASLEFKALAGEAITIVNHPTPEDPDWSKLWWLTPRGWWLAGGELVKISAFYAGESR